MLKYVNKGLDNTELKISEKYRQIWKIIIQFLEIKNVIKSKNRKLSEVENMISKLLVLRKLPRKQ